MSTCSRTFTGSVLGEDPNPPDSGAPDTPSVLTPLSVTFNSFLARWSAAATGAAATGFKLDVATDLGYNSFVPGFNDLDVGLVTSQSVTGLAQNTGYFYRVRAYNGSGESQSTGSVFVQTATEVVAVIAGSALFKQSESDSTFFAASSAFITIPYTIEAWVKRASNNARFNVVFSKFRYGTPGGIIMLINEDDQIAIQHYGAFVRYVDSAALKVNTASGWTHIAWTLTGNTGVLSSFRNGQLAGSQAVTPGNTWPIINSTARQRIGSGNGQVSGVDNSPIFTFDGQIAEVRFWNVARSNAQIASAYNTRLVGNETGLVGYWPLVNSYTDQSASGLYTLTNQGSEFTTDGPPLT